MPSIDELLARNVGNIKLKILIFGPAVGTVIADPFLAALQTKRQEIRRHLETAGHLVAFPEEIVTPNADPPANNSVLQEVLLVKEYDFVVNLVGTPGSNTELGLFCGKPDYARKMHVFISEQHKAGFAYQACALTEQFGGKLSEYSYPRDLSECHLLGMVTARIAAIQVARFFSS